MRNAMTLDSIQSVLVLGAGSDIAQSTLRLLLHRTSASIPGTTPNTSTNTSTNPCSFTTHDETPHAERQPQALRHITLAARNTAELDSFQHELCDAGVASVDRVSFDATAFDSHKTIIQEAFARARGFDLVLVAFGTLGTSKPNVCNADDAVSTITTNFTGAASVLLHITDVMKQQPLGNNARRGTIVVLSSTAAERVRASNFIYGSSKAGLDAFCQGLHDSVKKQGIVVSVVRPGFVHTKMTQHRKPLPFATSPERVALDTLRGVRNGAHTVWSPSFLRWLFVVIRHLPRSLFQRFRG